MVDSVEESIVILPEEIIYNIKKMVNKQKKQIEKCNKCGEIHKETDKFLCIFDKRYTTNTTLLCHVCYKYHIKPDNCKFCVDCNKYVPKNFEHSYYYEKCMDSDDYD